ncbi:hypothetical protein A0U40_11090 [[Bacillus] sp. KCTC 13219]|uniref:hypothetical protein n=1 Tax=Metasolibacillus fluoroglycofenilyticus TaxID=1239396 RepID=UPI0007960820|nr:hypothetical protein [Metasolibacillus fluoroglycofenilyticus]KYG89335.1 hypothetical protein A0U40_11090 [[Bacillus] sp. KCTC 13219]
MEAKKMIQQCEQCGESFTIDFATANLSVQVARINGKTIENRLFIEACPNCGKVHTVASDNPKEWGNRKIPSPKRLMYGVLFSCLFIIIGAILAFYFAGRGIAVIWSWLFQ